MPILNIRIGDKQVYKGRLEDAFKSESMETSYPEVLFCYSLTSYFSLECIIVIQYVCKADLE